MELCFMLLLFMCTCLCVGCECLYVCICVVYMCMCACVTVHVSLMCVYYYCVYIIHLLHTYNICVVYVCLYVQALPKFNYSLYCSINITNEKNTQLVRYSILPKIVCTPRIYSRAHTHNKIIHLISNGFEVYLVVQLQGITSICTLNIE